MARGRCLTEPVPTAERSRRFWDRQAATYDQRIAPVERRFFADSRRWVCARADGDVLEVAIGTGLNLPLYPEAVRLTGVDSSPAMLDAAATRAAGLGLTPRLLTGDAHALPFGPASFDTVVCTWALCGMADERRALAEMVRVLRPGGSLLLADHVGSTHAGLRALQRLADLVTGPLQGEYWTRRPLPLLAGLGLTLAETDRLHAGTVERLRALKPC